MRAPAMWVPVSPATHVGFAADQLPIRTGWSLTLVGRRAPGVGREQALVELAPLVTRRLRVDFGADIGPRVDLGPILATRGPGAIHDPEHR